MYKELLLVQFFKSSEVFIVETCMPAIVQGIIIRFLYSETVRLAENLKKLRQLFESVKDTTSFHC
jgi:hypothetical protein